MHPFDGVLAVMLNVAMLPGPFLSFPTAADKPACDTFSLQSLREPEANKHNVIQLNQKGRQIHNPLMYSFFPPTQK